MEGNEGQMFHLLLHFFVILHFAAKLFLVLQSPKTFVTGSLKFMLFLVLV